MPFGDHDSERARDLDRQQRRHAHHMRRWATAVVSFAVTFVLYVELLQPIFDSDAGNAKWKVELVLLAPLLAGAVALSLIPVWNHSYPRWFHYLGTAATLPAIALAAWAIWLRPAHEIQTRALETFNAYTDRFSDMGLGGDPGLGDPEIVDRTDAYVTTCARYSRGRDPDWFCLEIITDRPLGERVQGGFTTRTIEHVDTSLDPQGGSGFTDFDPYDCFGDTDRLRDALVAR